MRHFVDQSLDEFKDELSRVIFPIFVSLFLYMMLRRDPEAIRFFNEGKGDFVESNKADITLLETVHD